MTVWEILTFGARPYQDKKARDILGLIEAGERLKQPATSTIELYAVLLECKCVYNRALQVGRGTRAGVGNHNVCIVEFLACRTVQCCGWFM